MPFPIDPPTVPDPERFWAEILSAEADRIWRAFDHLTPEDGLRVMAHLRRMATEDGWQAAQRQRARTALDALDARPTPGTPEDR
jgi:hypothetical protein